MTDRIQLSKLNEYYSFLKWSKAIDRIFEDLLEYGSKGK